MNALIDRVLQSPCFVEQPPILVDIGASGSLPEKWRPLAPHSVGIAFDADSRDFKSQPTDQKGWRKLWLFERLVTATPQASIDFYLTRSPHCSSALMPDLPALEPWAFRQLFEVERVVSLPSIDLPQALAEAGAPRIDWFKCDSQGTDLRLFRSLPTNTQAKVLAADFEPGIIDAYRGEDKLHHVMAYMDSLPFWVSKMRVKGTTRIGRSTEDRLDVLQRRRMASFFSTSPGWSEITYVNCCTSNDLTERDLLLAWVIAVLENQLGFAIDVAMRGRDRFGSVLFEELASKSLSRVKIRYPRLVTDFAARLFGAER